MSHMSREMKAGALYAVVLAILLPVLTVLLIVPALMLDGFVVAKLWNWFVMEPFHTFKMHYALGIGLSLLVGFMARTYVPVAKGVKNNGWVLVGFMFGSPLVTLLTGYIVHHWV
jgi:hypothetical protein